MYVFISFILSIYLPSQCFSGKCAHWSSPWQTLKMNYTAGIKSSLGLKQLGIFDNDVTAATNHQSAASEVTRKHTTPAPESLHGDINTLTW